MKLMSADLDDKGFLSIRVQLDTLADSKTAYRILTEAERGQKTRTDVPVQIAVINTDPAPVG